jgi:uncharacterized protein (DUF1501 family)
MTSCITTCCNESLVLSRRHLLGGSALLALWGLLPRSASAAGSPDPRLLTIILRGGLDGLALASPAGDPDLVRLRGKLMVSASGEGQGLPLEGPFVLNPSMPFLHSLYLRGEALIVHAVATPYRERSHFDGQDVLESGLGGVGRTDTGWLNRALSGLGASGAANPAGLAKTGPKGLAMGAVVPLVMRGGAPVLSWIPQTSGIPLRESTIARLMDLYAETDPGLAKAFNDGIAMDKVAFAGGMPAPAPNGQPAAGGGLAAPPPAFREFVDTAEAAARFLGSADGPRIGCLSYNGWDTHASEGVHKGLLANRLAGLDAALKAFADKIGPAWKDTAVVVVTEFGRTARVNGTDGTDHGTGSVALVLGGAVRGGRVIADWPGLTDKALHEGRDLRPTRDLRSVLKGLLRDHIAIPEKVLAEAVFPGSSGIPPLGGLVA